MDELPDILSSISKPDLFQVFKLQLKKDFESSSLNGDFADGLIPNFDEIINTVSEQVLKAEKRNALLGLLYRIDISERQIQKLSTEKQDTPREFILAELIVKRELQKIVIRSFYKNKD